MQLCLCLLDHVTALFAARTGGDELDEHSATVEWSLSSFNKSAHVHVLPQLISPDVAAEMVAALPEDDFNTDLDSVDSLPTYEFPVESFNKPSLVGDTASAGGAARASLRELTAPVLSDRILPFVRARYQCPDCIPCTQIFRRYVPGERRHHPAHFDTQAFVTVVVSLSSSSDFDGGLFVRRGGSGGACRTAVCTCVLPMGAWAITSELPCR
jgi:hypothetical protein